MLRLAVFLLLALAVPPAAAQNQTPQGTLVIHKWAAMDLCAKKAQAAFPDFTAAENAKRDAQLRACLESQNLPPPASLTPQQ